MKADYLIKNASIIDGDGKKALSGDLAIAGEFIAGVGSIDQNGAQTIIDAEGKTLTPGFIDMHSHSDVLFFNGQMIPHKVLQGVTTEVVGQDGISVAPLTDFSKDMMADILEPLAGPIEKPWLPMDMKHFLSVIANSTPQLNVVSLTGHCNLRLAAIGHRMIPAGASEIKQMQSMLNTSLEQGAFGLSLGLIYPPSSYSDTRELIDLGVVVSQHDALIVSHMRNEQDDILEAIEEMISIGRSTGARIHISHLKCMGKKNWGKMPQILKRLEQGLEQGVQLSFDQYPYEASSTTLSLLLPPWAQEGGWSGFSKTLEDEDLRNKAIKDIEKNIERRGGPEAIWIASAPGDEAGPAAGKSLAACARMWGLSPADAAFFILKATRLGTTAIYHAMSEKDVECAMGHQLHTVGSDGVLVGDSPHPRACGTFPRIVHRYHSQRRLFSLEEAIRDMTSKSADVLKLRGRGRLKTGYYADLLLFDPAQFKDHATYDQPRQMASGLEWVFINGKPVIAEGEMLKNRAGSVLFSHNQ